jgi:hypothetical protein
MAVVAAQLLAHSNATSLALPVRSSDEKKKDVTKGHASNYVATDLRWCFGGGSWLPASWPDT